jgi:hypothetical protein
LPAAPKRPEHRHGPRDPRKPAAGLDRLRAVLGAASTMKIEDVCREAADRIDALSIPARDPLEGRRRR